ncbi:hypothetical protein KDW_43030 [Dictyobacter vulcani]|uniref:Uncharacterized protein n=1 Tax=Dictyobacter vulcani TaxID=2607529 RepID=A0A5J4KUG4_9CHLR|nr:hypothetical protein KDW_43030 [Dictyobacter vulcani]
MGVGRYNGMKDRICRTLLMAENANTRPTTTLQKASKYGATVPKNMFTTVT